MGEPLDRFVSTSRNEVVAVFMSRRSLGRPAWRAGLILALAAPGAAQDWDQGIPELPADTTPPPLFDGHDLLRFRVEADFNTLRGDRDDENPERPGTLFLLNEDGSEEPFTVQIRTRGNFRLQPRTCRFPPLRLNFKKGEVEGTFLHGQDKIKLVTHCRDSEEFEQNVVEEYLVYRLYNVLTPMSFRVRLARILYVDTAGEEDDIERYAIFLEAEEDMAARLAGTIMPEEQQLQGIWPDRMPSEHTSRVALFQYMVGNTDYSLYGNRGVEPHNAVPVVRGRAQVIPVPYDFDWTGVVRARYARPAPQLGTRNVRQRVYRGLCRPDIDYPALYAFFQERREELTAVIRDEAALTEDNREDLLDYLEDFWEVLEDEGRRRRRIEDVCRTYS